MICQTFKVTERTFRDYHFEKTIIYIFISVDINHSVKIKSGVFKYYAPVYSRIPF